MWSNEQRAALSALAQSASAHDFRVNLTERGLLVSNPDVMIDCPEKGRRPVTDTITCRPYGKDAYRLWFFTSWGTPLADVERVMDAVVALKGHLSGEGPAGR